MLCVNFIWLSYVAVRDAAHARGYRVLPLGAPLHPEHESTSFGGLWGASGAIWDERRRRQYENRPSQYEVSYAAWGGFPAGAKCPPRRPQSTIKGCRVNLLHLGCFGLVLGAFGVNGRRSARVPTARGGRCAAATTRRQLTQHTAARKRDRQHTTPKHCTKPQQPHQLDGERF